jgi:hypothetical protein
MSLVPSAILISPNAKQPKLTKKNVRESLGYHPLLESSLSTDFTMAAHRRTQQHRQDRSQIRPTHNHTIGNDLEKGSSDNRLGGENSQRP